MAQCGTEDASQQDVSYHINQIYAEGEQDPERTHKKFLLVRQEGNRSVRRNMSHYNLDMIIAVDFRVKSHVATHFRQWARIANSASFHDQVCGRVKASQ